MVVEAGGTGQGGGAVSRNSEGPRHAASPRDGGFDVSVVIVNRNTRELLASCLKSIAQLPDRVTHETIVVDNGSTDGSVEMLEREFPSVRLIRNSANTGFAFPNNQGIAISRGRYVLLLNSDTEIHAHAFDRLVDFMDAHPGVGAAGPRLTYADGRMQPSCFKFHSPWRTFSDMTGLTGLFVGIEPFADPQRSFDHSRSVPTEALLGAALMVRREVIDSVGVLDERFRIHCNEIDWCRRMQQAGWERYFVADASVMHHMSATLQQENRAFELQGEMLANLFDYHRKHYGRAGLGWFRLWTVVGYGGRAALYRVRSFFRPGREQELRASLYAGIMRSALAGDPGRFKG